MKSDFSPHSEEKSENILWCRGDILKSLTVITAASLIGLVFYRLGLSDADIITVYILGVLITALWTKGRLNNVFSAFLSVIVFNFLFTEPRFTLFAYDAGHPITFLIMLISGIITSSLASKTKLQAKQAAEKAYRTETLFDTSTLLQDAENLDDILNCAGQQLHKLMERPIIFYNRGEDEPSFIYPQDDRDKCAEYISKKDLAVVQWVMKNGNPAGAFTEIYSDSSCLCLPLKDKREVSAVAAVPMEGYDGLSVFEKNLMSAILEECGLALDKVRLAAEKHQAETAAQQETLRSNLLRTISHDLRTPLTNIMGSAGVLLDEKSTLDSSGRRTLYQGIYDDSVWLISLVENLLSVTRLENGAMNINLQPELIEDVFSEALSHLSAKAASRSIKSELEDDMLMAYMDAGLIIQVIINLINNAVKYTPADSEIKLSAKKDGKDIVISVSDCGEGIPDKNKEKLFDMFYTMNNSRGDERRGMGLGLALCHSIVSAHRGRIWIEDNKPHGAVFSFTLRAAEVNPPRE